MIEGRYSVWLFESYKEVMYITWEYGDSISISSHIKEDFIQSTPCDYLLAIL